MRQHTLALLATAGLLACAEPTAAQDARATTFQRILTDSTAAYQVIGAQAAVLIPGRQAWSGVVGRNGPSDPMRPELMIGTGSITKMYTAIAALVLIDRGKFRLTDTVGRWFPNAANVSPAITVKQLLQHTSGLAEYGTNPAFQEALAGDTARVWRAEECVPFVEPPLFPPGAGWNASNTNRLLLGLIVERESGQTLGAFLRKELFANSPSSWSAGDGPRPDRMATHWLVRSTGATPFVFTTARFTAIREIYASAMDIARFGERVFAGDLLSPALRAEMLATVPSDGKVFGETGGGLGIRRYGYLGRTVYGHSGATAYDRSLMLFDRETRIVVAVTINQGQGHNDLQFRLAPALLQAAITGVSDTLLARPR